MEHEIIQACGRFLPEFAKGFIFTDWVIFACYLLIPLGLIKMTKTLPSIAWSIKVWGVCMIAFILSCGLTHAVKATETPSSSYEFWIMALRVNWLCAIASAISTIWLWFIAKKPLESLARKTSFGVKATQIVRNPHFETMTNDDLANMFRITAKELTARADIHSSHLPNR